MITSPIKSAKVELKSATIRDFTGGWNVLDSDLNLSTKYSVKDFNVSTQADGTKSVRYGTRLFVNLTSYMSSPARIVNMEYFVGALIFVCSNGDVIRSYADGTVARIWDAGIAAGLPGSPSGWSATDFASFAQFNGDLIICNGVDKPILVNAALSVDYLQDLATSTNINTPIGRYVTVVDRYLIIAGDPVDPNRIHISARDTSGTFFGDPDPNDATFIDVGSVMPNSSEISGIAEFRGKLAVGFPEGTILGTLGIYDADNAHAPDFSETFSQYGAISHRAMSTTGDDMLMLDLVGVPSFKKTVFTGTIRPERVSDLVDPEIAAKLSNLTNASLQDRCWAVYNQKFGQFMFFIPDTDEYGTTVQTTAYTFVSRPALQLAAWARYDGWNFTCGCRTVQGEVFFGDANGKVWLHGSDETPLYSDYLNDPSVNSGEGVPITFDWELPWSDMNVRTKSKLSKYISFDTIGTAGFSVSMYVDRFRRDAISEDAPLLTMNFTGGDAGGFGDGYSSYGGGRNTSYEALYAWPAKFQIMKLRFRGQATAQLKFVSISVLYQKGGFNR